MEPRIESAPPPREPRRPLLAPDWLQVSLILGLLGAAVYVAINGRYLWGALLAVAGAAFGLSFVLRRMVGDEYGRS
jgi:hypothetical protein